MKKMIFVLLFTLALSACATAVTQAPKTARPTPIPSTTSPSVTVSAITPATESVDLWEDVTGTTIGETGGWTNKVELADINNDGLVDLLFANGGDYETPGKPEFSQVFLNQGAGKAFKEVTQQVFGPIPMLVRVIKVRDVNSDGQPDIIVGTTYQSQSRLYLGDGSGKFTDVTATHLPQMNNSIGDLELGDVDGDSDLDIVLADWGPGSPMTNAGGRTMLWLNDGTGHFSDATALRMPSVLVKFSWELEFVDVDNDYDLDILVSCKICSGSFLFENDGIGNFTDVTRDRLPQFTNNYDFEAMNINGDDYLDLVTINDGPGTRENIFLNNQQGGFDDATKQLWPDSENPFCDDNMDVFLDFDSDGDSDLLIGSLDCPDRLLLNDGSGHLKLVNPHDGSGQLKLANPLLPGLTIGTLAIAVADLNGDMKLDVVQAQGEADTPEKVYFGKDVAPDTSPPMITLVEKVNITTSDHPIQIHARIHDRKSPTMPYDWQSVILRWTVNGQTQETPMQWHGEYLWRGTINELPASDFNYQICATDAANNTVCASP
jgi:hypothetical protein